jgi:hypothetical protein
VEVHRNAAVGADEQRDARLAQLLKLPSERRPPRRGQLEVREPIGMLDRFADVVRDVFRQPFPPRGGTASWPTCPTALTRSPSIRITLLRIAGPANPSMSVPPTSAFTARV